jgi:hypothetical protein
VKTATIALHTACWNLADQRGQYNAKRAFSSAILSVPPLLILGRGIDIKANRSQVNTRDRSGRYEEHMTTFDKREEGFEKQFAHDEDLRFKAMARRNKLLGLWAAEKLGMTGGDADAYAKSVVMADFEEAGDNDVFRKVRSDLDAKKVAGVTDEQLRGKMIELLARAVDEIKAGR